MATNFLWGGVGSVMHLLTTELNAQTKATITAYGPEINNSVGYQMGQMYIHLASAAFVIGDYFQGFLVPSNDTAGSTYPTLGTTAQWWGGASSNYLSATIYINGTTAAQDEILQFVTIPLGKFKTVGYPGTGVNLGATGNTADLYPTPSQY